MARFGYFLWRLVILGALVAAGLVAFRSVLAERVAVDLLAARGFPQASVRVARLEAGETVLSALHIPGAGLRAGEIRLRHPADRLLHGEVAEIAIRDVQIDPGPAQAAFRRLVADLPAGGGGARPGGLKRLTLSGVTMALPGVDGGTATLDAAVDLSGPAPVPEGRLRLDLPPGAGMLTLDVTAQGVRPGSPIRLSGEGWIALAALEGLGGSAGGVEPATGRAAVRLAGAAAVPEAFGLAGWLAAGPELDVALALESVGFTGRAERLTGTFDVGLRGADGRLDAVLSAPARLRLTGVAATSAPDGGPPSPLEVALPEGLTLFRWQGDAAAGVLKADLTAEIDQGALGATINGRAEMPIRGGDFGIADLTAEIALAPGAVWLAEAGESRIGPARWMLTGRVSPDGTLAVSGPLELVADRIEAPEFLAEAVRLTGDLAISAAGRSWDAALTDAAGEAAALGVPGQGALEGPVNLRVPRLALAGAEEIETAEADIAAEGLAGEISGTRFAGLGGEVQVTLSDLAPLTGAVAVARGAVRLKGARLAVADLGALVPLGEGVAPFRLDATLDDLARPARVAPLDLTLSGVREPGEPMMLTGRLSQRAGPVSVPLSGTLDPAAAMVSLQAGPTRLDFAARGLQPSALSPLLAGIGRVDGPVEATATVALGPDGALATGLTLGLEGVSLRQDGTSVEGAQGTLQFSSLAPPRLRPARIRLNRLVAGVPVGPVSAEVSLARGGQVVQLRAVEAGLAGGQIAIAAIDWDVRRQSTAFEAEIRDVSLGQLLSEWRIEGVRGEGVLRGRVPVRVSSGGVSIAKGAVAATGPGAIRVDWGPARDRLVSSGDQVRLAVTALEDFRYTTLDVGINQPESGELALRIGLAGANPDVLDGYPFQFNVTLTGELAPILAAIAEGRRIGGDLIQGGIGGQ